MKKKTQKSKAKKAKKTVQTSKKQENREKYNNLVEKLKLDEIDSCELDLTIQAGQEFRKTFTLDFEKRQEKFFE